MSDSASVFDFAVASAFALAKTFILRFFALAIAKRAMLATAESVITIKIISCRGLSNRYCIMPSNMANSFQNV